jgi:hypothetical protein
MDKPMIISFVLNAFTWIVLGCGIAMTLKTRRRLRSMHVALLALAALEESVKLQSHYASLLNQYDGGERMRFATAHEWIDRLIKTGKICER